MSIGITINTIAIKKTTRILTNQHVKKMTDKSDFKVFMRNTIKFLTFGFKMYEQGVCDAPIEGSFKLVNPRQEYGYTKKEASNLLGLSVRQFDRLIRKGEIRNGRKIRGITALYWDSDYIDKLSKQKAL